MAGPDGGTTAESASQHALPRTPPSLRHVPPPHAAPGHGPRLSGQKRGSQQTAQRGPGSLLEHLRQRSPGARGRDALCGPAEAELPFHHAAVWRHVPIEKKLEPRREEALPR